MALARTVRRGGGHRQEERRSVCFKLIMPGLAKGFLHIGHHQI
jgi:hypothetical protein